MHFLFGSADSRDYDILVIVDKLGAIAENKKICLDLEQELTVTYPDKPVNINLASASDGRLTGVFKGTVDEVNNSLLDTYHYHPQKFALPVTERYARDVGWKNLRVLRILLSFLSRSPHRVAVKAALAGPSTARHKLLSELDIGAVTDLGQKNITLLDFRKMAAFQIGQALALASGVELYTKADIAKRYPALGPALRREESESVAIENIKQEWLRSFDPTAIPQYEKASE